MILLIHGDDIERSRKELMDVRLEQKGKEIRTLNGKSCDKTLFIQAIESASLYDSQQVILIENLLATLGKKEKILQEYLQILPNLDPTRTVIFWEEKEVSQTVVRSLGQSADIRLYKIPVSLFQFLDALRPADAVHILSIYRQSTRTHSSEIIFSLFGRRIRQLIMVMHGLVPEGLAGWQTTRLTRQARLFTMKQLTAMYTRCIDSEYSIKTGATPYNLSAHLEQIIVDI